jgi:alkylated DNA repair dioxygenase AlkB
MKKPPILYLKDFVANPDALHSYLNATIDWDTRMRARKTASFGASYNYSQIVYQQSQIPDNIETICQKIGAVLGFVPNNCLINAYPDGRSSMGFHSDDISILAKNTGVAIVSLGAERDIIFQNKLNRSIEFVQRLLTGSLLYMPWNMQEHWLHAIPKTTASLERISLTFRLIK